MTSPPQPDVRSMSAGIVQHQSEVGAARAGIYSHKKRVGRDLISRYRRWVRTDRLAPLFRAYEAKGRLARARARARAPQERHGRSGASRGWHRSIDWIGPRVLPHKREKRKKEGANKVFAIKHRQQAMHPSSTVCSGA